MTGLWRHSRRLARHFGNPLIWPLAFAMSTVNLFSMAAQAVLILFMARELKLDPGIIGVIEGLGSLGALAGAVLAAPVARYLGMGPTLVAATLVNAVGALLLPVAGGPPLVAAAVLVVAHFLMALAALLFNINQVSLRQAVTPSHVLGRVNASIRFLAWGLMPLGSLLGGALGGWMGLRAALVVAAGGMLLAPVWVLLSPVRRLREAPAQAA